MQVGTKKAIRTFISGLGVIAVVGSLLAQQNHSSMGGLTGKKTGQIVINPQFDGASDFADGLAAVGIGKIFVSAKYGSSTRLDTSSSIPSSMEPGISQTDSP